MSSVKVSNLRNHFEATESRVESRRVEAPPVQTKPKLDHLITPKTASVIRTESSLERFQNAKSKFESYDKISEENSRVTSPAGSRSSSISQRPGSRSDDSVASGRQLGVQRSRSNSPTSPSRSSSVSSHFGGLSSANDRHSISSQENGDSFKYYRGIQSGFQGPSRVATSPTKSTPVGGGGTLNGTSVVDSAVKQRQLSGGDKTKAPPDKPGRNNKINVKESISKHQNWFKSISSSPAAAANTAGGSRTTADSVDSVRRSSVQNDHKPGMLSGGGGFTHSGISGSYPGGFTGSFTSGSRSISLGSSTPTLSKQENIKDKGSKFSNNRKPK